LASLRFLEWITENPNGVISLPTGKTSEYFLKYTHFFLENWDKPGVIGSLGTLLGKNGVNIAGMTFGRDIPGGKAVSALNIDSAVSGKILDEIRGLDNILSVKLVKL